MRYGSISSFGALSPAHNHHYRQAENEVVKEQQVIHQTHCLAAYLSGLGLGGNRRTYDMGVPYTHGDQFLLFPYKKAVSLEFRVYVHFDAATRHA